MTALITIATIGADAGPFDLYSDVDGYSVAFETGITRSQLLAGYTSTVVTAGTTIIRTQSTGVCVNFLDITVVPTTTTTTTTSGETGVVAGGITTTSTVASDCSRTIDGIASFNITVPDTITVGTQVYSDLGGVTPFVGDGDFYKFNVNFIAGASVASAQIDASGVIVGSIFLCP